MSVSHFEFILLQGPITAQLAHYLSLIDICRITAVSSRHRFIWPVKYNALLCVLKKALAHFAWPCLPPLNDDLKRRSCEYNVFCNMMETQCRIANLDLSNPNLIIFCIGGCGHVSMLKHEFVGPYYTKFTICKTCFDFYDKVAVDYVFGSSAPAMHGRMFRRLLPDAKCLSHTKLYDRFYKPAEAQLIPGYLSRASLKCACSVWPVEFVREQVNVDVERRRRKKAGGSGKKKRKTQNFSFADKKNSE